MTQNIPDLARTIYVTVAIIVDSWNAIGLHFVYPDIWLQIWVTSFNPGGRCFHAEGKICQ